MMNCRSLGSCDGCSAHGLTEPITVKAQDRARVQHMGVFASNAFSLELHCGARDQGKARQRTPITQGLSLQQVCNQQRNNSDLGWCVCIVRAP